MVTNIKYPLILDGGLSNVLEELGCDLNHELWSAKLLIDQPELIIKAHLAYLLIMGYRNLQETVVALERTKLANERTFLAYFRTFIVFLSSGFAILKLEFLQEIKDLGYVFILIAPILLIIGISRFFYVKRHIRKYYHVDE